MAEKTRKITSQPWEPVTTGRLPTVEQEAARRDEMERLFSTAARAGAGGTRTGVPGLRPMGLSKASAFVDAMTPGKMPKKERAFSKDMDMAPTERRDVDGKLAMMLPRTFCPDCNRTNRPKAGGVMNFNFYTDGRWGLRPHDLVMSFFCDECVMNYRAKIDDKTPEILLNDTQGIRTQKDTHSLHRLVRIKENTESYIRSRGAHNLKIKDER